MHAAAAYRTVWDTFTAMGVVREFPVAGLEDAARPSGRRRGLRAGAIDETSLWGARSLPVPVTWVDRRHDDRE